MKRAFFFAVLLLGPASARAQRPAPLPIARSIAISSFGARGDGRTDDTKAFIAALTAAAKAGEQLQLENKTYLLKETLQLPHTGNPISIAGSGGTTLLFAPDRPLNNGIVIAGNSGVELKSFTIRGSGAGLHNAISVRNASNVRLDHLQIESIHGTGISALSAISLGSVDRIWITNSIITGVGLGPGNTAFAIWNYYKLRTQHIYIEDNHISGNTVNIVIGLFDTDHAVVSGNVIDGGDSCVKPCINNGYGILFYRMGVKTGIAADAPIAPLPSPVDETITGNQIVNTAGSGIYLQGVHGATVSKNTITNTSLQMDDRSLPAGGIALNGSNDIQIRDNKIDKSGKGGIVLATTKDVLIEANQVNDAKMWGIHLRVAQVRTTIRNNSIDGAPVGIMIESSASETKLGNNSQTRVNQPIKQMPAH